MMQGYVVFEDLEMLGPADGVTAFKLLMNEAYQSGRKFRAFYGFPVSVSEDFSVAAFGNTTISLADGFKFADCKADVIQKKKEE